MEMNGVCASDIALEGDIDDDAIGAIGQGGRPADAGAVNSSITTVTVPSS